LPSQGASYQKLIVLDNPRQEKSAMSMVAFLR
jgi:hypothetical protein